MSMCLFLWMVIDAMGESNLDAYGDPAILETPFEPKVT